MKFIIPIAIASAIMKHDSKVKQEMKWEFIIIILLASFIPVNICIFKIIHRKLQQLSEDSEPPPEQADENHPHDTVF